MRTKNYIAELGDLNKIFQVAKMTTHNAAQTEKTTNTDSNLPKRKDRTKTIKYKVVDKQA